MSNFQATKTDPATFVSAPFDYLVIGGGTAGLVVAARLSEDPSIRVGVLEAGPAVFDDPIIDIPGRFGESLGTEYDWKFETIPQPGINGRKLAWPRGRVLGGTSALNFMTWNRGCREDYDKWEQLGNAGWGWDGLLSATLSSSLLLDCHIADSNLHSPYFKKSEHFHEPAEILKSQHQFIYDSPHHGASGPIQSIYSSQLGASHTFWHETLHTLGVKTNKSHFSGSNVGVWTSLTSVFPHTRKRCYSTTAYYLPAIGRPNLVVLTEALVQEILIQKEGNEWVAKGARFMHNGAEFRASAAKEVILSAGSVQSPQLLELSGIGNPEILERAGIQVKIANKNVGENLQEHISKSSISSFLIFFFPWPNLTYNSNQPSVTAMIYELSPTVSSPESLSNDPAALATATNEFCTSATGVLTQIPSSIAYLPFSHFISAADLTSLTSAIPVANPRDSLLASQFSSSVSLGQIEYNFDVSNYSPYFTSEPGKVYGTMLMMLQYPFSVGSIHIPSSATFAPPRRPEASDKPIIDPRYYLDAGALDFKLIAEAQKFAAKICATTPLSQIIKKRVFPPEKESPTGDEEDFSDWIRDYTITDWHPVGTCSMGGSLGIEAGVVDARLRVYGVQRLRVVDASIMPLQVSAHIQATVYAIGEKGAALVLEDYYNRSDRQL